jgi:hypothetical protein
LEETLEADISKLPKTGHFYFALTTKTGMVRGPANFLMRQEGNQS